MPDISLFLNLYFVLPNPACPSAAGVLLLLSTRTLIMEVGIHGLVAGSMAIELFKFNQLIINHCFVSKVRPQGLPV